MIILPYKENFIINNFIQYSSDGEDDGQIPDYDLFLKLNSSDQYYLAQNYNWDNGVQVLRWIIESPKCDKGTASLIFWTSEPDFYFKYTEATIPNYEKGIFLLLQLITEKFNKNEFKKSNLKFDPTVKVSKIDWNENYAYWDIPKEIKISTKGLIPFSFGSLQNMIWQWQRKRKLAKREARKRNRKI